MYFTKFFFKKIALFLFFLCSTKALTNEQWMRTRTLEEFQQILQKQAEEKQTKTLCLLQLKKQKIPSACYSYLKNKKPEEQKKLIPYLDEKCRQFSATVKDLKILTHALQQKSLSPFCRKQALQQKNLREYQLRDRPPRDILIWYFKKDFE